MPASSIVIYTALDRLADSSARFLQDHPGDQPAFGLPKPTSGSASWWAAAL
jgi:hypothetical protein